MFFAVYLQLKAGHLLSIYGSLAALMMFFIFVYFEAIIVLAGAMMCAQWTEYVKTRNQQRLFNLRSSESDVSQPGYA